MYRSTASGSRISSLRFGLDVEARRAVNGDGGADHAYGIGFGWDLGVSRWSGFSELSIRFGGERREVAGDASEHRFGVWVTGRG